MPWSFRLLAAAAIGLVFVLAVGLFLLAADLLVQEIQAWRKKRRRPVYRAKHSSDGDTVALPIPTVGGVR